MKVLYAYHGVKYAHEAQLSIGSLQRVARGIDIHVVSTESPNNDGVSYERRELASDRGYAYKVAAICEYSESEFLFLDTDTNVVLSIEILLDAIACAPIVGVSDPLLDTFKHVPGLVRPTVWADNWKFLPEINSGVVGFNRKLLPDGFMATWRECHQQLCAANSHLDSAAVPDQPSLRQAILRHKVVPLYLGSDFNYRACYPQSLYAAAKIVHVHDDACAAHMGGAGKDGDVVVTFPWGGSIGRQSILNRALYKIRRAMTKSSAWIGE